MNSTPLFVILFILLSACSSKQNTDFIVEDYLKNIRILEENNEFFKEKIADAINTNPSRKKMHKANIDLSCSLFNSIYTEINSLTNEKKRDITKRKLKRIYSSSLEIATKTEIKFDENVSDRERKLYKNGIFKGITNDSFWYALIKETNNSNEIALSKLHFELIKSENNLLKYYDDILNKGKRIYGCPGPFARVVAPSSYIMCGAFYEAEVHLFSYGYYNIEDIIRIVVNGNEIPIWGSYGHYKVKAPNYAGIHKVEGYVFLNTPEGLVKEQFRSEWLSFLPAISFEFDDYQKVKSNEETEFAIHVPGFRQEDLIVETSKGKVTKQKGIGKYKILVDEKPNTQFQIKVSVKMPDGSIRKMGERKIVVE